MKRSRFTEEQIIGVLKEVEAGEKVKALCARHNISEGTYFTWNHNLESEAGGTPALRDGKEINKKPRGGLPGLGGSAGGVGFLGYTNNSFITLPWMSVRRKSRPW